MSFFVAAPSAHPSSTRQAGSGTVEFAIIAIPVMLLGFACLELSQWFYMKQAISLALLEAARAGITQHGQPAAMEKAFNTALQPLYPPAYGRSSAQRVYARHHKLRASGLAPWQIQIISPAPAAFVDFADNTLAISQQTGFKAINNNYQKEQDHAWRAKGWAGGIGPASGQTIYQANTLVLRLTYPHKPLTPGVQGMLRLLGNSVARYSGQALARGYLPLTQEIQLTMQSHPVDWPELTDGTVVRLHHTDLAHDPVDTCQGMWCLEQAAWGTGNTPDIKTPTGPNLSPNPGDTLTDPSSQAPPAPESGLDVPLDDPACGVTLCCIG